MRFRLIFRCKLLNKVHPRTVVIPLPYLESSGMTISFMNRFKLHHTRLSLSTLKTSKGTGKRKFSKTFRFYFTNIS